MKWKYEKTFPEGGFVRVAESAGFCFGVRRATDRVGKAIEDKKPGDRLYTLGKLIHNDSYTASPLASELFPAPLGPSIAMRIII